MNYITNQTIETMTDLELVDKFCQTCREFIDPALFREIQSRGLYDIVNYLPASIDEAKAIARARLARKGKYFGDPQIEQIADTIDRLEALRGKLNSIKITETQKIMPVLTEMQELAAFINDFYKS